MEEKNIKSISGLMGKKDSGEKTIRSVYKVKRADDTNTYDRVHFETDSKMVCDATDANVANMVARRSADGSIAFQNATINGTLDAYLKTTLHEALEVKLATTIGGTLGVTGNTTLNNALTVKGAITANSSATIDGTLRVKDNVTLDKALTATGNISTSGKYSLPNCTIEKLSSSIKFGITGTGVNDFYFNKPLRFDAGSAVSTNLNADKVDNCDVNDSTISDKALWTSQKIEDTKVSKTVRVNSGKGIIGGASFENGNITLTHDKPGTIVNTLGAPRGSFLMVRTVGLDEFGHVASVVTEDMSKIFATFEDLTEGLANANETVSGQYIKHSITDANGNVVGQARNEVNNVNMKNYSIDYNSSKSCIEFTFV